MSASDYVVPARAPQKTGAWYAVAYYGATSSVVFAAVALAQYVLDPQQPSFGFWSKWSYLDGRAYAAILRAGYWYDPGRPSYVAYFPAFPLLGGSISKLCGLPPEGALLVVSHASLLAAFVIFARYVEVRTPSAPAMLVDWTLLALGLWPWSLFFRMAYTESLFLLLLLCAMSAMHARRSPLLIALIIGLATATRPVGVALMPVFAWHLWNGAGPRAARTLRMVVLMPLACWGLLAYMGYLYLEFGDPFVFASIQKTWAHRPTPWAEKVPALLCLEPFWTPFLPSSVTYWAAEGTGTNPLLSYGFVNPVVLAGVIALVSIGAWRRWLDAREVLLCACLLLIPYVTMGYDNLMLSQPRFASVAFPVYMVMGRLLTAMPRWAAGTVLLAFAALLVTYSALFAAGYGLDYKVLY